MFSPSSSKKGAARAAVDGPPEGVVALLGGYLAAHSAQEHAEEKDHDHDHSKAQEKQEKQIVKGFWSSTSLYQGINSATPTEETRKIVAEVGDDATLPGPPKPTKQPPVAPAKEVELPAARPGNYKVIVHIIEVMNLLPSDPNGSADPFVMVQILDHSEQTSVRKATCTAVIDETLIFDLQDLTSSAIEQADIVIRVMDDDLLTKDDVIGTFVMGLYEVYCQPSHEVYKQTVGLLGVTNSDVRGYVKLSATVVGPGEKPPMRGTVDQGPAPKYTIEFLPEHISTEEKMLKVCVYWAEALPLVDENAFSSRDTDLYVRVDHGEHYVCTKAVCKEKPSKSAPQPPVSSIPVWHLNNTLLIPITEPSVMRHVCVSVWDYDRLKPDDLLGVRYFPLSEVPSREEPAMPVWVHFYGDKKSYMRTHGMLNPFVPQAYQGGNDCAFVYHGRVLLSMHIENISSVAADEGKKKKKLKPSRTLAVERLLRREDLNSTTYCLKVAFAYVADLPSDGRLTAGKAEARFALEIDFGGLTYRTVARDGREGFVWFGDYFESGLLELSVNTGHLPDMFIYLISPDGVRMAFIRVLRGDLLDTKRGRHFHLQRFEWHPLLKKSEEAIARQSAGVVLMRYHIERSDQSTNPWLNSLPEWQFSPCQLRLDAHGGRDLPTADTTDGSIDPYLVIRFLGQKQQTHVRLKNVDPNWSETLTFECLLPIQRLPELISSGGLDLVLPVICGELWDQDRLSDDFVARTVITPSQALDGATLQSGPKSWPLFRARVGDIHGSLLLGLAVASPQPSDVRVEVIQPALRPATVEILVLGLRSSKDEAFKPRKPFVQFDVVQWGQTVAQDIYRTKASKSPTATNPNYAQMILVPCALPEDPIFAPVVRIVVNDTGFLLTPTSMIGHGRIPLDDKLPWLVETHPEQSSKQAVRNKLGRRLELEDLDDSPCNHIAHLLKNRAWLDGRVEDIIGASQFCTYNIMAGNEVTGSLKTVAHLKAQVRVLDGYHNSTEIPNNLKDMSQVKNYEVRLYVLTAQVFTNLSRRSMRGKTLEPTTYMTVSLGSTVIKSTPVQNESKPAIFKAFTFQTALPGISRVRIAMYAVKALGPDLLIGEAFIDLEDRCFNPSWREIAEVVVQTKPGQANAATSTNSPVETVQMYLRGEDAVRASAHLWLDLLTESEASSCPLLNIDMPAPIDMQLRVVVWSTRDVKAADEWEKMSDLYVKCWPTGMDEEAQETDTHWRLKTGKGSFNWRMVWNIKYGPTTALWEFPYLYLQLWDRDIISANDCIGEVTIDLKSALKQAMAQRASVHLYDAKAILTYDERQKKKKEDKKKLLLAEARIYTIRILSVILTCLLLAVVGYMCQRKLSDLDLRSTLSNPKALKRFMGLVSKHERDVSSIFHLQDPEDGMCLGRNGEFGICGFDTLWATPKDEWDGADVDSILGFPPRSPVDHGRIVCLGRVNCGVIRLGQKTKLSVMDCDECGAQLWTVPTVSTTGYLSSVKMYTIHQVNEDWMSGLGTVKNLASKLFRRDFADTTSDNEGQTDEYCVERRFRQIQVSGKEKSSVIAKAKQDDDFDENAQDHVMENFKAVLRFGKGLLNNFNVTPSDTFVVRCDEGYTHLDTVVIEVEDLIESATDQLDDLLDRSAQWPVRIWRFVRRNHTSLIAMAIALLVARWIHMLVIWYNRQSAADSVDSEVDESRSGAREMTRVAKNAVGLADEKDRKAIWFTCRTRQTDQGQSGGLVDVGDVCITIEVLPAELSIALPVGKGRDTPNQHPYLPPPLGRMHFSLNPFYILLELLGTKRLMQVTLIVIFFVVLPILVVVYQMFLKPYVKIAFVFLSL